MDERWFTVKSALEVKIPAKGGASPKWLREQFKKGLRHARVGGKILMLGDWIDQYFKKFEVDENKVDRIVNDIMRDLKQ